MIFGVAVGSLYLSLRPNPDGWINGPWRGIIRIDSTPHAEHELHRAGILAVRFRAEDGFSSDEHKGEGEMTLSGDVKPYALGLYGIKLLSKEGKSSLNQIAMSRTDYFIIGKGATTWSSPEDTFHLGVSGSLYGSIEPHRMKLHTSDCTDLNSSDCTAKFRMILDLAPTDRDGAFSPHGDTIRLLLALIVHFGFALPIFIIFFRQRFRPWKGVYFVVFFTLLAGLTFGVSWLVALAAAFTTETT